MDDKSVFFFLSPHKLKGASGVRDALKLLGHGLNSPDSRLLITSCRVEKKNKHSQSLQPWEKHIYSAGYQNGYICVSGHTMI